MSKETKNIEKNNETSLMQIFMLAPALLCIVRGTDHVFELANTLFMQFIGNKEVINKSVREAMPEWVEQGFFELLDKVYATGETITVNEMPLKLDIGNGTFKEDYFNVVFQPMYNANQRVNGIYVHAIAVTEQVLACKKNEENAHRLHEMVNSSPSLISILKGENMIIDIANAAILESWGKGNVIGQSLFDAMPESVEQGFDKLLLGVYKTGEPVKAHETPVTLTRNGIKELVYYDFIYQAQRNKKGDIKGVAILANEVTWQVEARNKSFAKTLEIEQKLKEITEKNLKQLQNVFQNAPAAIAAFDGSEQKFILANTAYEKIANRKAEDLLGKSIRDVFPELKGTGTFELYDHIFKTGESFLAPEYAVLADMKNDGVLRQGYLNFSMEPLKNDSGEIYAVLTMTYDITEQVLARKRIEASEKRFRNLVEQATLPMLVLKGEEWIVEVANEPMLKLWHVGKEAIGKPMLETIPEIKDQPFIGYLSNVLHNGVTHYGNEEPAYFIRENGEKETIYFNYVYQPYHEDDDSISGVMVTASDVTEQVVARKEIEENEERQSFLLKFSDKLRAEPTVDAIANCALQMLSEHFKLDRCYIGVYQLAEDRGVFPYQVGNERVPPIPASVRLSDFPDALRVAFDRTLVIDDVTKAEGLADTDRQNLGALGLCALVAATLRHGENNPLWSIVSVSASPRRWTLRDVKLIEEVTERTWAAIERAKAEQALHKSEEKYRTLFTSIDQGFALCELVRNKEGKGIDYYVLEVNPTYEKQTGLSIEMVLGKTILQVFPTLDKWWIETYSAVVDNQHPTMFEQYFENAHRWFEIKAYPGEKDRFAVLFSDITERKLAEEKLKESIREAQQVKEQLELSIAAGKIGLWHWDVKNDMLTWSKEQKEIYGVSDSESTISSAQFNALIVPEDLKRIQDDQSANFRLEHEYDFRIIRKNDGETRWIKSKARNILDPQGALLFISGVNIDVTEQVITLNKIEESEQEIRKIKEQLELSLTAGKIGLWNWDVKTDVLQWSNEQKEMYGIEQSEELNGLAQIQSFILPEDWERIVKNIQGPNIVLDQEYDFRIKRKNDGKIRWLKSKSKVLLDENGNIEFISGVNIDISEQVYAMNEIKESENRFRSMADASPVFIWTIDANGLSSYYNKTFRDFIGVSAEEDISDWGKIVHPDDVPSIFDTMKRSIAEHHFHGLECRLLRADGQWRWVLAQGNPRMGAHNEFLGFVGSSIDITERKLFETKLIEANELAENVAKSKQQFLSNMSHEIRTPMNAIVGFTNVVLKTTLNEKQQEYINAIKTSGESLLVLIDDILDLAKVDAGKMIFQHTPFKLSDCIATMLHLFDVKTKEKNIALVKEYDVAIPEVLLGDSVRLKQILMNLISNAIKFTEKGHITVRARLLNEDYEQATIEFTISDTGIGIAENKLNDIFGAFEQAHSNSPQSYGGTGLGLSIVKQLVEHQGGSVSVKSQEGEGSAFGFVLPFEKTEAEAVPKAATEEIPTLKNVKILVAEDVKLNQLLIRILLEDFGVDVDIADNGKIALEKLKIAHYDMILMDLQMPEMNGFEATTYIRNQLKSNIPIIALTADVTTVDVEKCKAVGMNDYISKPIEEKLLYEKIIKYLPKPN